MQIPEIRTARLTLRELRLTDAPGFHAMHEHPDFHRYLGAVRPSSENWFRAIAGVGMWQVYGHGFWAVIDEHGFAGHIGIADFQRGLEPPLPAPEAAWVFAQRCWGRGYATEAIGAMLDWADAYIERTCCMIEPEHAASVRVATKHGYLPHRTVEKDGLLTVFIRDAKAR
ncbi:MAG: GNAT family N-acetyltransferase [Pseudomonadota bacterium]